LNQQRIQHQGEVEAVVRPRNKLLAVVVVAGVVHPDKPVPHQLDEA
jgi:hypothetical protein